jgi:hypothetical protein
VHIQNIEKNIFIFLRILSQHLVVSLSLLQTDHFINVFPVLKAEEHFQVKTFFFQQHNSSSLKDRRYKTSATLSGL